MEKELLVTNIDGLLLSHDVFYKPHEAWFRRAIEKTGDGSLEDWIGKENYFLGVHEAMEKIMPEGSEGERTLQARKWYHEDTVNYIKNHPEEIKKDIANKLISLKDKYKLILMTTSSEDYVSEILKVSGLENIYDGIVASKTNSEPKKEELLGDLLGRYGKPKYYLTGKINESISKKFLDLGVEVLSGEEIGVL